MKALMIYLVLDALALLGMLMLVRQANNSPALNDDGTPQENDDVH